ncbi:MAG: hypothetical protein M3P37_04960 [Actinomycetota bacterium]|nr:hypothetical protein [Actinomycetota bacterium]
MSYSNYRSRPYLYRGIESSFPIQSGKRDQKIFCESSQTGTNELRTREFNSRETSVLCIGAAISSTQNRSRVGRTSLGLRA